MNHYVYFLMNGDEVVYVGWTSYAGSRERYAKTQAVVLVDSSELPGGDLNEKLGRGIVTDKDGVL